VAAILLFHISPTNFHEIWELFGGGGICYREERKNSISSDMSSLSPKKSTSLVGI